MKFLDRNRPLTGQPQTFVGQRGNHIIVGEPHKPGVLVMRDIYDAVLIGVMGACGVTEDKIESTDDLYKVFGMEADNIDVMALAQNACVEVEKRLGIYPNLPERDERVFGDRIEGIG